jgi:hypothetical protein
MAGKTCPKCGAPVSPTDVQCLDCGADLAEAKRKAREELQEQSVSGRTGSTSDEPKVAIRSAASAGRALPGESSKETRLRVFDKQAAEVLKAEASAALVLALLAALAGLALLGMGLSRLSAQGLGTVFGLRPGDLQDFSGLVDTRLVTIVLVGGGLAAVLVGVGMFLRRAQAIQAVRDVEAGEKPEIVGLNAALEIGLLALAVFCPWAGIIIGIIMKLSKDTDVAGFGGTLIWISLGVVVLLGGNMLYGKLADIASHHVAAPGANIIKDTG